MVCIVDTLNFALSLTSMDFFTDFLGLDLQNFELARPEQNYENALYYQGIKISFGGKGKWSHYVNMSGKGCRTWESLNGCRFDWIKWFTLLDQNYHPDFRRVDIAVDTFDDLIAVRKCCKYFESGKIAGSCRTFKYTLGSEEIFYAGSTQSQCLVRIYNKALERGFKDGLVDGHPWFRCEMQLRDDNCKQFISEIINAGAVPKIYAGHLLEFLRFTTKPNDKKNSQRLEVVKWWRVFCEDAERIQFVSSPGSDYNYTKCQRYITNQCGSSVKAFILANNWNAQQAYDFFTSDDRKLNKDQQEMVKALDDFSIFADSHGLTDQEYELLLEKRNRFMHRVNMQTFSKSDELTELKNASLKVQQYLSDYLDDLIRSDYSHERT